MNDNGPIYTRTFTLRTAPTTAFPVSDPPVKFCVYRRDLVRALDELGLAIDGCVTFKVHHLPDNPLVVLSVDCGEGRSQSTPLVGRRRGDEPKEQRPTPSRAVE
jgi:hypothetical protein